MPGRVLVLTHFFDDHGGGVERVAGRLVDEYSRRGLDVRWIASDERRPQARPSAVPVRMINGLESRTGLPYPLPMPGALRRIRQEVAWADVVHVHEALYAGNVAATRFARSLGKRIVLTQHVGLIPFRNRWLSAAMSAANWTLGRWMLRRADQVTFVSNRVQHYWSNLAAGGHSTIGTVIPNGVDFDSFYPHGQATQPHIRRGSAMDPVFAFVGRFVEKKGLHVVGELARLLPRAHWLIAGWGPINPGAWDLSNVTVLGRLGDDELRDLYQQADLLVLPSVGEGFPLVIQESMACGTPVAVSTEVAQSMPGLSACCWHAEPTVAAFSDLLRSISPDALRAQRPMVLEFARRNWSWDTCTTAYLDLLRAKPD